MWDTEDLWLWLVGLAAVLFLGLCVWAAVEDDREWQAFSAAHHCRLVSTSPGESATTITTKGNVGVTYIPGKDGYACDDGVVHYRDN